MPLAPIGDDLPCRTSLSESSFDFPLRIQPQGPVLRQHRGSTGILKPELLPGLLFIPIEFDPRGSRECGPFRFQALQTLYHQPKRSALFCVSEPHPRLIAMCLAMIGERLQGL
jgi:hypothetical protein